MFASPVILVQSRVVLLDLYIPRSSISCDLLLLVISLRVIICKFLAIQSYVDLQYRRLILERVIITYASTFNLM